MNGDDEPAESPARAYEDYLVRHIYGIWTPLLLERAAPQPNERALDLPCGTGVVTRAMAERVGPGGSIVGFDLNPDMLNVARSLAPVGVTAIEWRQGDAQALPFADASFDLVVCQQGFQFVPDRPKAAREIHRVLAPAGRVAVACWSELDEQPVYDAAWTAAARRLNVPLAVVGVPFSATVEGMREVFEAAGFNSVDVQCVVHDVHFPSSSVFVERTIASVSGFVENFGRMSPEERQHFSHEIAAEISPVLDQYADGDGLQFPLSAVVTVARR